MRVPKTLKVAARRISDRLGYTRDEIGEVALASLFGSPDGEIREKRKKIEQAAQQLSLTFNHPGHQPAGELELAA